MPQRPANSRSSRPETGALEVRLLGVVDWDAAVALQEWLTYELTGRTDANGVLLLCEHPPLVSIGREGRRAQVVRTDDEMSALDIPLRWASRSGGAVVHAPGQLAIYPLLPLDRLALGLGEYRRRLEQAVSNVCHDLRVPAKRLDDSRGLWSRGGQVAHFGSVVKSWVTQFGMWLNVAPVPSFLRLIRSEAAEPVWMTSADAPSVRRGPPEDRVTSLQEQLLRRVSMHAARESALRHVAAVFGYETVHTFTGHPQLARTRQRVCVSV
jgi:lipoyl(octanoyl) transferase